MKLVDRLGMPWPDHEVEEVVLPAWVIDLCDEARSAIIELAVGFERMTIAADQMAGDTNSGSCDAIINDSRKIFENICKEGIYIP